MTIKQTKYKTIEIKEFPLIYDKEDIFNKISNFSQAIKDRNKLIHQYCLSKVGTNYVSLDFPKRLSVKNSSLPFSLIHIDCNYYAHDRKSRVSVSKGDYDDYIYTFYQILIE